MRMSRWKHKHSPISLHSLRESNGVVTGVRKLEQLPQDQRVRHPVVVSRLHTTVDVRLPHLLRNRDFGGEPCDGTDEAGKAQRDKGVPVVRVVHMNNRIVCPRASAKVEGPKLVKHGGECRGAR